MKGVTSISADLHKYGQATKGVSTLLYRNKDYRRNQFFIYPNWNGGVYFSTSYCGSRSPAFLVAAYGVLIHLGKQNLVKQAQEIYDCIYKLKTYIRKELTDVEIIGDPKVF